MLASNQQPWSFQMVDYTFDYPTLPASTPVLSEAESLCEDILRDIELSQAKLSLVVLKASRLARLLNDFESLRVFEFESTGYPSEPGGIRPDIFELGKKSGRTFYRAATDSEPSEVGDIHRINRAPRANLETGNISIHAAQDPNLSISSANQYQMVRPPKGNARERGSIRIGWLMRARS